MGSTGTRRLLQTQVGRSRELISNNRYSEGDVWGLAMMPTGIYNKP